MAETDPHLKAPEWCQAATPAALKRFSRGSASVITLQNLLTDSAKLERSICKIYKDFRTKWQDSVMTQIGSNLAYDQVKAVMNVWMETIKQKEDLHAKCLNAMYASKGPIEHLHEYIHSETVNTSKDAIQSMYMRARKKQMKLEKEIDQLKDEFYQTKDKANDFKPQLDEAYRGREDNPTKFQVLLGHWQKLEAEAAGARTTYKDKLRQEKSTRMTFIEEMKKFQNESDVFEMTRLENLKTVLGLMLKSNKNVEFQRKEKLKAVFEEGISELEKLDIEREIGFFNQFYVYEHKFPQEEFHPSEVKEQKEVSKQRSSGTTEEKSDLDQNLSARDNTAVFVQTRVPSDDDDNEDSWEHSRPIKLTTPRLVTAYRQPDVEIPNAVMETTPHTAPIVTETTVENFKGLSDSDSDSYADTQKVHPSLPVPPSADPNYVLKPATTKKVKVYAVKDFTARSEDELTFKAGQKIYITDYESAPDGRAYGYIKKGKMKKKKKYGFFPVQLISTAKMKDKESFLKKKFSKKGFDGK
ncbi:protein kinase C and casein kinase substrate in neurons protein 2-like [Haliotis asinina]|uniref:protein kinase C and casein kinase substrate in neurons protein 2-like n=1 Tax=Haliotis asinina TaxID=109174 RepID=UPI00353239A8